LTTPFSFGILFSMAFMARIIVTFRQGADHSLEHTFSQIYLGKT
jgi:hypothetical protein